MDQDLWMKALQFHGPLLMETILGDVPKFEGETEKEKLNICMFIKSKLNLLFKPCESTVIPLPVHTVPPVPVELFRNLSLGDRRDLFYKSLSRGNILTLRVINDTLNDDFKLLVLCKDDWCMKLDDLSLVMYLPKLDAELTLAGGKLVSNELIRAAVCSCCVMTRKLYVTLDSNILDEENVKLGKITENDLPFYMKKKEFGSSYVEYLHHSPQFNNPNWAQDLQTVLNIDRKHSYSFFDDIDGAKYPAEEYGTELKKKQDLMLSNTQYEKATKCYENGNFSHAFTYLNNAIKLYPKNTDALVSRGTLYANINNLSKAFVDMEEVLKIDPNHVGARKQMSVLLVVVARMHMTQNDRDKAQESLDAALNLDTNNEDAIAALEEVKRNDSSSSSKSLDKAMKMLDKHRITSNSSEGSSSRRDDLSELHDNFLKASTKAFLTSMKKRHHHSRDKKRHHHSHRTRSPRRF